MNVTSSIVLATLVGCLVINEANATLHRQLRKMTMKKSKGKSKGTITPACVPRDSTASPTSTGKSKSKGMSSNSSSGMMGRRGSNGSGMIAMMGRRGSNGKGSTDTPTVFCTTSAPTRAPTSTVSSPLSATVAGLPSPITDYDRSVFNTTVGPGCTIADLDVTLAISHARMGHLKIWIETPSGGLVGLVGKPGDNEYATCFSGGSSNALIAGNPVTFDDDSANDPEAMGDVYPGTTTFFSAGALPELVIGQCGTAYPSPATTLTLTDLNGGDATGTWTVFFVDDVPMESGTLESASFDFVCA